MLSDTTRTIRESGRGYWVNEHDIVYVRGTVDGKPYKKSTKEKATKIYLNYIKKNHRKVLLQLIEETKPKRKVISTNFVEFGKEILELTSKDRNENSQSSAWYTFNKHIATYFIDFELEDIKMLDIERWQNALSETLASSTVKKTRDLLNVIMKKAYGNDLIAKNPCEYADAVKVTSKKTKPYTALEMKLMFENSDGWLHAFLLLAFSTGLRTGELMALKWDDIHFEDGFIDLRRSISKGIVTEIDKSTGETITIKNGEVKKAKKNENKNHERLIELIPIAIQTLSTYKLSLKEHHNEWIFTTHTGDYFKESATIVKYHFKPLLFKLGIEYKTIYATRHSFISMMMNSGYDKLWIQNQVGHSADSKITEKSYFTYERNEKRLSSVNNMFTFPNKEKKA